jgi:hypothetical protein
MMSEVNTESLLDSFFMIPTESLDTISILVQNEVTNYVYLE